MAGKLYLGDQEITPVIVCENGGTETPEIPDVPVQPAEPSSRFGLTLDAFFGPVDADGTLNNPDDSYDIVLTGVKKLSRKALRYFKYNQSFNGTFSAPDLQSTDEAALDYAFYYCTGLTAVSFPALEEVGNDSMCYTFIYTDLTSVSFPSLKKVGSGAMMETFKNCTKLASVSFPALESLYMNGMYGTFYGCSSLQSVSFPALVSAGFMGGLQSDTFSNCPALTEIHFRADAQSVVRTFPGYSNKFGATNATIYFDL